MKTLIKLKNFIRRVIERVFLFLSYLVGVGLTSLISRIFDKDFLIMNPNSSGWSKVSGSKDLKKMY